MATCVASDGSSSFSTPDTLSAAHAGKPHGSAALRRELNTLAANQPYAGTRLTKSNWAAGYGTNHTRCFSFGMDLDGVHGVTRRSRSLNIRPGAPMQQIADWLKRLGLCLAGTGRTVRSPLENGE